MAKKVVLIDNYDSFTYNLYQYLLEMGAEVEVFKNDEVSIEDLKLMDFSHLVISPGPGNPTIEPDFGISKAAVLEFYKSKPVLGVCLGHQGIAAIFGGKVIHAPEVFHGRRSEIKFTEFESPIYKGLPKTFEVMRYHSLIVESGSLPADFEVTAITQDKGLIMSFQHKKYLLFGIQYHPESIGTLHGFKILQNFINLSV
jgi:anthranilate synthase/aminodeoxychorismate synthase-like glutamine amidotransferase